MLERQVSLAGQISRTAARCNTSCRTLMGARVSELGALAEVQHCAAREEGSICTACSVPENGPSLARKVSYDTAVRPRGDISKSHAGIVSMLDFF
jgi:hypothetical protein